MAKLTRHEALVLIQEAVERLIKLSDAEQEASSDYNIRYPMAGPTINTLRDRMSRLLKQLKEATAKVYKDFG